MSSEPTDTRSALRQVFVRAANLNDLHEKAVRELEPLGIEPPRDMDGWKAIAIRVGIPFETVQSGDFSFADIVAAGKAYMARKGDSGLAPPAADGTKTKKRGRNADFDTQQAEAELATKWVQAREAGVAKAEFAKEHDIKPKNLDRLLDNVRHRKSRSE